MSGEGFGIDLWTASLFFRVCRRYRVDGREPRLALLRLLVKRGQAKYIRDVSEYTAGKKVLRITKGSNNNAN